MSHDLHTDLPGYDDRQLLVDGCWECEQRAAEPAKAIEHMDAQRFEQAWVRTIEWMAHGTAEALSDAERKVFAPLWAIIVQLERRGVPIGLPPKALSEVFPDLVRDAEAHRYRQREIDRQEAEVDAAFRRGEASS